MIANTKTARTAKEKTQYQISFGSPQQSGEAPKPSRPAKAKDWATLVREMRKDPTIGMLRDMVVAPAVAAGWSYDATDEAAEGSKEFIESELEPIRQHLLESSLYGCVDFGWQAYEKVWRRTEDGAFGIGKLKPLLQDYTEILVVPRNGAYAGLINEVDEKVELKVPETLLVNINVEGTNWYGEPLMARIEGPYIWWQNTNASAEAYDNKMSGSHYVVYYPDGSSMIDGVDTPNDDVARMILHTLESGAGVAIPGKIQELLKDVSEPFIGDRHSAWRIDILSDNTNSGEQFNSRLKYLDALKARAMGLPERSVFEGDYGTKAEAETHASIAIVTQELRHSRMVQMYNWHLVNALLRLNYGEEYENTVKIVANPIEDETLARIKAVFMEVLKHRDGFLTVAEAIDTNALLEKLQVPTAANSSEGIQVIEDEGE